MAENPYYLNQPPVDPIISQQLEQRSVNQTWYSDRMRNENLDLVRENNVLVQDNRYFMERMNQVNSEQQQKVEKLWDENQQQSRLILEMEKKYNEEVRNTDMNQQEIYRMRIQFDDMRNHLEKIVAEKDSIILDLRRRLQDALSERDGHLDARMELEKSYRKGVHMSLSEKGLNPSLIDSKSFGHSVKISQIPGYEGQEGDNQDFQDGQYDTVPRGQQQQRGSSSGGMSYKNTVGLQRTENENYRIKEELRLKDQQVIELQAKLQQQKAKFDKQLEDEKRGDRKKSQFNNQMQSLPYAAENEDLRQKKAEAEGAVKKLGASNREIESKLRKSTSENEQLQRKVRVLEQQVKNQMQRPEKTDDRYDNQEEEEPKQMVIKVSEDRNLLDGIIGLMHYLRESTVDMIFEVFVRSANQAHQRKTNSLIIFSINLKELKEKNIRGFVIVLFLYKKMKKLLKMYYPNYGKAQVLDDKHVKMSLGKGGKIGDPQDFRDDINMWLESSVKQSRFKRDHQEKDDMNKDLNYLFRLLAIKYRMKFPMQGAPYKVDVDLKVRLENKITSAMLSCFIDDE